MLNIGERIILTLWVGSLWAIGYIAVPLLFHALDKHAAGELAAPMFTVVNGLGLVCGGLLLFIIMLSQGKAGYKSWRVGVIVMMVVVSALILFVLQPQMAALKVEAVASGAELGAQFGRLHGISSILYLLASALGLLLVAGGGQRRTEI